MRRFGAAMTQFDGGAIEDMVNPEDFVAALLSAIDERLREAKDDVDAAVLRRVLTVVAGVLPLPLSESARHLATEHLGARAAKLVTRGRAVTGPVLWARDVYGTRWAVVAPFTSVDGPDRWYLWDVDTCGYEVVTVHSGFYPSAESAMAAWQPAAGPAADGAALTAVDDAETFDALVRGEMEEARLGGENEEQYAEFLRCRRLGKTVREATRRVRGQASVRLTADDAEVQFAQRLRQLGHHDGPAGDGPNGGPARAGELAAELADSWSPRGG